ncbi:hypothetical protein [Mammaliicoccus lentus]|uniref:hypothetical protein n=1 Tax=Mammaliicoccus lentus TaxID=42858 RepID=UPI002DBBA6A2|nr:hypothetical protein [Mammaliicoccus lentus]MEB8093176.1 hypothetical protein [Mammaliicoccus lentus]
MKFNEFKDSVTFYGKIKKSPEAFDNKESDIHTCRCTSYDPSEKDFRLGDLNLNTTSVTLIIRAVPNNIDLNTSTYFVMNTGFYKGLSFNIKHISKSKL